MSIVSTLMQFIAPMVINKLAGSLGINQSFAQKAITAALPTILAAIVGKVSKPGGADALFSEIGKQDPGILGNLGNLIGGPQQASIAQQGMGSLGSLLGGSTAGGLASAIGKYAGIDDNASKGLLGMLAPVVLGGLGQTAKQSNLGASGLASMLMSQKDSIAQAIPGDFAKMAGGVSGLLDGISMPSVAAAAPAPKAAGFNPLPIVLGLAAAAGLYFLVASPSAPPAPEAAKEAVAPAPAATETTPPTATADAALGQITNDLTSTFGSITGALASIKDAASAQDAVGKLTDSSSALEKLAGLAGPLSGDAKKIIATAAGSNLTSMMPMIDTLMKIPGVSAILQPIIDKLVGQMTGLSKLS